MKIGILVTGTPSEELRQLYGSYAQMFIQLLTPHEPTFEFDCFAVSEGQFPPSVRSCDGWIITGSRCGVYDNLPWMPPLKQLVREAFAARVPLVGICFGHQIVASAFGAPVEKYAGGWGVGLHRYRLEGAFPFVEADRDEFVLNAMHQDQVMALPDQARLLASSPFCAYAALVYGDSILTFQPHPEFTVAFERELIRLRLGSQVPEARGQEALDTLADSAQVDSARVGGWIASFLRGQGWRE